MRRKRQRGRAAFLTLLRRVIAFIPLGIVLSRQPFMVKPRMSGVNAAKMRPLELAIVGAVQFAAGSPTFVRNPQLHVYLNATGRVLLTPFEYLTAQQSKRAMPAEKTWQGAYKKTAKGWGRLVDRDASVREMATAPQPNLPLIGSVLLVIGTMLCPLFGGVTEYLIVIGCVLVMQGGRQLGMEAQPELYVAGVVAVLAIAAMEYAGKAPPPTKAKRR